MHICRAPIHMQSSWKTILSAHPHTNEGLTVVLMLWDGLNCVSNPQGTQSIRSFNDRFTTHAEMKAHECLCFEIGGPGSLSHGEWYVRVALAGNMRANKTLNLFVSMSWTLCTSLDPIFTHHTYSLGYSGISYLCVERSVSDWHADLHRCWVPRSKYELVTLNHCSAAYIPEWCSDVTRFSLIRIFVSSLTEYFGGLIIALLLIGGAHRHLHLVSKSRPVGQILAVTSFYVAHETIETQPYSCN